MQMRGGELNSTSTTIKEGLAGPTAQDITALGTAPTGTAPRLAPPSGAPPPPPPQRILQSSTGSSTYSADEGGV
jgi:hypothetical protein